MRQRSTSCGSECHSSRSARRSVRSVRLMLNTMFLKKERTPTSHTRYQRTDQIYLTIQIHRQALTGRQCRQQVYPRPHSATNISLNQPSAHNTSHLTNPQYLVTCTPPSCTTPPLPPCTHCLPAVHACTAHRSITRTRLRRLPLPPR